MSLRKWLLLSTVKQYYQENMLWLKLFSFDKGKNKAAHAILLNTFPVFHISEAPGYDKI